MPAIAVIVAGGAGRRFRSNVPKQFASLGGKPLLAHTVARFEAARTIDRIVLVLPPGSLEESRRRLVEHFGVKPVELAPGAETRQASVWEGLRRLDETFDGIVAVHDGVRPLVPPEVIDRVVGEAARSEGCGAIAALPLVDTLKEVSRDGLVTRTVDRDRLYRAQTPQCFRYETLRRAFESAIESGFTGTDEAALVERMGVRVRVVEGSDRNLKVTTRDDLALAELYLEQEGRAPAKTRTGAGTGIGVGIGFDAHRLVEGRALVLGGVRIDAPLGLAGHSDGDALLHALTDALLGAVAAGDIGSHFPPNDPRWKDASSDRFVEKARDLVRACGRAIDHVDIVVIAEAPRLSPHVPAMRARIAALLEIDEGAVSVKAKTTDGMGFTGRGEGIAVQAMVAVSGLAAARE